MIYMYIDLTSFLCLLEATHEINIISILNMFWHVALRTAMGSGLKFMVSSRLLKPV